MDLGVAARGGLAGERAPLSRLFSGEIPGGARAGLQGLGGLLVLLSILMVAIEIMNSSIDAVGRLAL
jgi:hypothetical protein